MKSKQLITMLVLLVATLAGYLVFGPGEESDAPNPEREDHEPLAGLEIARIAAIEITTSEGRETTRLRLEKKGADWNVAQRAGYPADTSRIENLVESLMDMKILRKVPACKNQLARLHLAEPGTGDSAATRVSLFAANGKPLKVIHLGKALSAPGGEGNTSVFGGGGFPDRRFVMIDAKPDSAAVVDQTFSNANANPADWINRTDFFDVQDVLTLAVDYPGSEATNSWKLARENTATNWTLAAAGAGEMLDTNKLSAIAHPLQSPTFNDVLVGDGANLSTNVTRITLGTADQFTYTLSLGKPNTDGEFPLQMAVSAELPEKRTPAKDEKPEDKERLDVQWQNKQRQLKIRLALHQDFSGDKWTYLIPGYTISGLLMKRGELLAAKPPLGPVSPLPEIPVVPPSPPTQPEPQPPSP